MSEERDNLTDLMTMLLEDVGDDGKMDEFGLNLAYGYFRAAILDNTLKDEKDIEDFIAEFKGIPQAHQFFNQILLYTGNPPNLLDSSISSQKESLTKFLLHLEGSDSLINKMDVLGFQTLVDQGDDESILKILELGFDINKQGPFGVTLLGTLLSSKKLRSLIGWFKDLMKKLIITTKMAIKDRCYLMP